MSAAREREIDATPAVAPVAWAVHEALDAVLAPRVRTHVLACAGWSETRGRPVDPSIALPRWVDARLFPRLVEHMTLTSADELRRHLHALLERVQAAPARVTKRRKVLESGSGPVFRLEGETLTPEAAGGTLLAWANEATVRALKGRLPAQTQVVIVKNAVELALTLAVIDSSVSVVFLDRREADETLETVLGHHLSNQRVLVWGPESLTTPEWRPILDETERAIGCAPEASLDDVADLCVQLLGAR